jgi:hypothetical protein
MSPESVRETVVHLDSQPITEEMVQWLDKLATELGFRLDLDALRRNTMLGGAILFADLAQGQATMWAQ